MIIIFIVTIISSDKKENTILSLLSIHSTYKN